MNTGQKILTVVVLGCFAFINVIFLQYSSRPKEELLPLALIWLTLAVVYVGLFFVLKRSPK